MLLVVGLGNPGAEYAGTRHNCGFEVVDRLAARHRVELRRDRTLNALAARAVLAGREVLLVEPLSYMNLSGMVVRRAMERAAAVPADLMLVCDDYHLPPGVLRMRTSGSAGGHNGLTDVARALGGEEWPRLRIGIGEPTTADPADYVLARFRPAERDGAGESFDRAADAVEAWAASGAEAAMAKFNGGPRGPEGPGRA